MAVPSLRHRAGKIEIDNKARQAKQRAKDIPKQEVSAEEHNARLEMLKSLGLMKK